MKKIIKKYKSKISFYIKQKLLKNIFSILNKISSLAIVGILMLYIIGVVFNISIVKDDIVYNDIKKQIPKNSFISEVVSADIHGLGNNSIIVLVSTDVSNDSNPNELLIFDEVGNTFLKYFYRPFKIGSSYILKYRLSLESEEEIKYGPTSIEDIELVDLTGDQVKEIVTYWQSFGASDGLETPCIISWQKGEYKLLGSFPPGYDDYLSSKEPLEKNIVVSEGDYKPYKVKQTEDSREYLTNGEHILPKKHNYYNRDQEIYVSQLMISFDREFYDVNDDGNKELIIYSWKWESSEARRSAHYYRIDVYTPGGLTENNRFDWNLDFSISTPEKVRNVDYLKKFLLKNYYDPLRF